MSDSGSDPPTLPPATAAAAAAQDPTATAAAPGGDNVLPCLMQVYNTMIQSKTPEGGPRPTAVTTAPFAVAAPPNAYTAAAVAAAGSTMMASQNAEWNAYAAASAAGGTSLPQIPSIPPNAFPNAVDAKAVPVQQPDVTGRNLRRKRPNPATTTTTSSKDEQQRTSPAPSNASSSTGRGKTRRKAKETDARWSKRFSWPEDLHRDFVSAIFDVGLKHSSPSTILEHMPKHDQITSERVKSHLQKYRLHRIKSKKEFMSAYDAGLKQMNEGTHPLGAAALNSGEVASFLTHSTIHEKEVPEQPPPQPAPGQGNPQPHEPATVESEDQNSNRAKGNSNLQDVLTLPRLTEAEKQSPIGASMGYLMGLFSSLKQQLMVQRAAAKQRRCWVML